MVGCAPLELFRWGAVSKKLRTRSQTADLDELVLDFHGLRIDEAGAQAVARRLSHGLRKLELNFAGAGLRFGAAGARHIAEHIPEGLLHLDLSFQRCNIGEAGARAVAERIPAVFQGVFGTIAI